MIVTNAHVTNAETDHAVDELIVTLSSGDSVRGRVVGEDPAQDLAVVKIDRNGLPTVPLGDSDSLEVGDAVVAIGNALGIAGNPTVTSGIVSGLGLVGPGETREVSEELAADLADGANFVRVDEPASEPEDQDQEPRSKTSNDT